MTRTFKIALGVGLALIAVAASEAQTQEVAIDPISDVVWDSMQGVSWHVQAPNCAAGANCTCPGRNELALLTIPYISFEGDVRSGQMIVSEKESKEVAAAFNALFKAKFPFQSIELVEKFKGDGPQPLTGTKLDIASMDANNTSAFNCRMNTSGTRRSEHATGEAIDINPIQNPYVSGSTVEPAAGKGFDEPSERVAAVKGLIMKDDPNALGDSPVVEAFKDAGWRWGGEWTSLKDYQHVSKSGN